jgi:hypothetical protein
VECNNGLQYVNGRFESKIARIGQIDAAITNSADAIVKGQSHKLGGPIRALDLIARVNDGGNLTRGRGNAFGTIRGWRIVLQEAVHQCLGFLEQVSEWRMRRGQLCSGGCYSIATTTTTTHMVHCCGWVKGTGCCRHDQARQDAAQSGPFTAAAAAAVQWRTTQPRGSTSANDDDCSCSTGAAFCRRGHYGGMIDCS